MSAAVPNSDVPICSVCEERPAEGTFWSDEPVCRACAQCAIEDGHMKPGDFEWWTPRTDFGRFESPN
jgi:hypothetical protein